MDLESTVHRWIRMYGNVRCPGSVILVIVVQRLIFRMCDCSAGGTLTVMGNQAVIIGKYTHKYRLH